MEAQPGGAHAVASEIARHAASHALEQCVLAVRSTRSKWDKVFEYKFVGELERAGVPFYTGVSSSSPINIPYAAFKFCERHRVSDRDIFHVHSDVAEFFGSWASMFSDARVIRTLHNAVVWPGRPLIRRAVEWRLRGAVRVGVSRATLDANDILRAQFGIRSADPGVVIYNGIAPQSIRNLVRSTTLERREGRLNLLFIGRLEAQKGVDVLLEALALMSPDARARVWLHAIGDGGLRSQLEQRSAKEALPVTFYGALFNARDVIEEADAVVVPSRFEGLPLVPIESIFADRQVIATKAPGLAELLADDFNSLLPVGEPQAFADRFTALLAVWSGGPMRCREALRRSIMTRCSVERMAAEYSNLYATMVS